MKNAQIEIFGLLIIVILITIIAIFVINFTLYTKQEPIKNTNILANNLINALFKTTICEKSLSNTLVECYQGISSCNIEDCNSFLSSEISLVINKLNLKQENYKLIISMSNNNFIILGNCNQENKDVFLASPYTKYINSELFKANLYICNH